MESQLEFSAAELREIMQNDGTTETDILYSFSNCPL